MSLRAPHAVIAFYALGLDCCRSVTLIVLLGQDAVNGCTADTECRSDGARRFTTSVHPLRQSSFLFIQHLRPSDVLPTCPTRLPCRCATFAVSSSSDPAKPRSTTTTTSSVGRRRARSFHRPPRSSRAPPIRSHPCGVPAPPASRGTRPLRGRALAAERVCRQFMPQDGQATVDARQCRLGYRGLQAGHSHRSAAAVSHRARVPQPFRLRLVLAAALYSSL